MQETVGVKYLCGGLEKVQVWTVESPEAITNDARKEPRDKPKLNRRPQDLRRAPPRPAAPRHAAPRRAPPRHAAPCRAAPRRAAPRPAAPCRAVPRPATPRHAAPRARRPQDMRTPYEGKEPDNIPHASFVERKPEPLGCELEDAADAQCGCIFSLEINEGKD